MIDLEKHGPDRKAGHGIDLLKKPLAPVNHNPDVLSCLANLSNDEVFTPPNVANAMLDLLPQEIFRNPEAKFLDPVAKSGVFLREITKRLMAGLAREIPDMQKRLDHILHEQVYGIAISELTSLLTRRTIYCAKYANSPVAISKFDNVTGNVRYKIARHTFKNGRCVYCGASQRQYERDDGLESHAYEFIHTDKPEEIFGGMKFDVIIGNPPYQLSDGGSKASAKPIYHRFIQQAQRLEPQLLSMVIPARWYAGGKGLNDFREEILDNRKIKILVDYFDSNQLFPNVDISGGICYFLYDKSYSGPCNVINNINISSSQEYRYLNEFNGSFIRFNKATTILRKIADNNFIPFNRFISSRKPFGIETNVNISDNLKDGYIKIYAYPKNGYCKKDLITSNQELIDKFKICIPYAYGERGQFPYQLLGKPFISEPNSVCSETYLLLRSTDNVQIAKNIISYIRTKLFRFLVLLKKNTQHATKAIYEFVPEQDFSKPWTDAELYKKYNLNQDEIDFIESMIKPMDAAADSQGSTDAR